MTKPLRQVRSIKDILISTELRAILTAKAREIEAAASTDPNPVYVASLDVHTFVTDRVVAQIGAAPRIGVAVEVKRGTLARALGAVGA